MPWEVGKHARYWPKRPSIGGRWFCCERILTQRYGVLCERSTKCSFFDSPCSDYTTTASCFYQIRTRLRVSPKGSMFNLAPAAWAFREIGEAESPRAPSTSWGSKSPWHTSPPAQLAHSDVKGHRAIPLPREHCKAQQRSHRGKPRRAFCGHHRVFFDGANTPGLLLLHSTFTLHAGLSCVFALPPEYGYTSAKDVSREARLFRWRCLARAEPCGGGHEQSRCEEDSSPDGLSGHPNRHGAIFTLILRQRVGQVLKNLKSSMNILLISATATSAMPRFRVWKRTWSSPATGTISVSRSMYLSPPFVVNSPCYSLHGVLLSICSS